MPQGTSNPVWYIQRYIQRYIQVHTKLSSLYRFPKHHINGALTWYITKVLWNFLGLFHEHISHFLHHQGQGCCLACIAAKFDKILKPGKKGKTGKYILTPAVSEKGAHNEVLLHQKKEFGSGVGFFPLFIDHRIVWPIYEISDFLKLSLKIQQAFFVEIPPRESRSTK